MKHLKTFNESKEELQKFCDDNLAYLLDDGFYIYHFNNYIYSTSTYEYTISLLRNKLPRRFNYNDIKYDFIPFIQIFNDKYEVSYIKFEGYRPNIFNINPISEFTIDEILNEKDYNGSDISGSLVKITWTLK